MNVTVPLGRSGNAPIVRVLLAQERRGRAHVVAPARRVGTGGIVVDDEVLLRLPL
jgi:hypothetical protein